MRKCFLNIKSKQENAWLAEENHLRVSSMFLIGVEMIDDLTDALTATETRVQALTEALRLIQADHPLLQNEVH